ncbi:MAG: STAS domain-containing protein [Endozoicomonadaceae bacterium]|nr:STAS domain-containing protein [Endozoicomonadaceae bacterium]
MSDGMYNFKLSEAALDDLLSKGQYAEYNNQMRRENFKKNEFAAHLDEDDTHYLMTLSGALNHNTFYIFKSILTRISDNTNKSLEIDCSQLLSINSTGLSEFLKLARCFSKKMTLFHVNQSILAILDMSGLLKIINIAPAETEIH